MAVFSYDAAGGAEWKKAMPIYAAAANLLKGAFVKWGVTDGTDRGFVIPAPVNSDLASEFIGILNQAFAGATLDNDPNAGTKYLLAECLIGPNHVYRTQYNTALTGSNFTTALTMTTCSSTSIVVTSGENISGGWLFTDAGYLHYVLASSSGTYTLKSAVNSAETTANKVLKLGYIGMPKVTLKSTFEQLSGGTAAQGAFQLTALDIFIKAVGFDWVTLDPTKHDGLNLPIANSPQFYADLISTQHFMNHNA
jgi:hypothetical protein